jgi:hypothetical protein
MNNECLIIPKCYILGLTNPSCHTVKTFMEIPSPQISIITAKKFELEKKIDMLLAEKEGLSHHLDDSSDRILLLERQNREQEMQLINSRHEVDEMKAVNQSLSNRYDIIFCLYFASIILLCTLRRCEFTQKILSLSYIFSLNRGRFGVKLYLIFGLLHSHPHGLTYDINQFFEYKKPCHVLSSSITISTQGNHREVLSSQFRVRLKIFICIWFSQGGGDRDDDNY